MGGTAVFAGPSGSSSTGGEVETLESLLQTVASKALEIKHRGEDRPPSAWSGAGGSLFLPPVGIALTLLLVKCFHQLLHAEGGLEAVSVP